MNNNRQETIEKTLHFVANKGWTEHGDAFLDLLAKFLGELLDVDYVLIDKYSKNNPLIAETIAIFNRGIFLPNMVYELIHTPCENVIGCKLCCYETDIQNLFPQDELLKIMNVDCYIGIPLWSSFGEPIGLIAIMHNKQLQDIKTTELTLQIVAIKAAHELEKMLYENELEKKNKELIKASNEIQYRYNELVASEEELRASNEELITTSEALKESYQELEKTKEKADENQQTFRKLFEDSSDAILLIDKTGVFVECNQAAINLLKTTRDQFLFKPPVDISPKYQPDGQSSAIKALQMIEIAYKKGLHRFDWTCLNSIGEEFIVEVSLMPIKVKSELMLHTTWRDITERIKQEKELKIAMEKAEESDRLKTAFLQNLSHEIRTPLNAISGFAGLLNKSDLSEEKRKNFVSIIQNSSEQLVSIVSDILTISSLETKQERLIIDKVCINNVIIELLSIFKTQAQNQNITLYVKQQITDKHSEIYTDKTKITQILTNLLTNALKFTHEGFVEFGYTLEHPHELRFYVKDTGIGIKPEFHDKIFERFRQANTSGNKLYGGTGLGLAISKAFVELLGGKIWVQSEPEKGSVFYFTIPYKPVNETSLFPYYNLNAQNDKTILVAEDEEFNFLLIEELLKDLPVKLIHAKNGNETIDIFKSNLHIEFILMDIKMPVMNGYEAAKILKKIKPDLIIIAQSAYALEHEKAEYQNVFDDYITKPIKGNDLIQKVTKYIQTSA